MLTTKNRIGLGHFRLDEGVAHTGAHRRTTTFHNDFRHRLRGDQVVDNYRAWMLS